MISQFGSFEEIISLTLFTKNKTDANITASIHIKPNIISTDYIVNLPCGSFLTTSQPPFESAAAAVYIRLTIKAQYFLIIMNKGLGSSLV